MHIVEELCLGAKERSSGVERGGPGTTSRLGGPVARQSLPRLPSQLRGSRNISAILGQDTGHVVSRAWLIGYVSVAASTAVAYHEQRTPAMQEEAAILIGAPNRRVADLEIESASRKGAALVFIKPYAATEQVKDLVSKRFGAESISEGTITAEQIDKDTLIDTHYGAFAANVMEQKHGI